MTDTDVMTAVAEANLRREYRPTAAGVLIIPEGRVLLVQSAKNPADWGFPQGGVETGEHPRSTLGRELDEELGVTRDRLPDPATWDYLGMTDLDAEPGRVDKRGFTKGKRYFFYGIRYGGSRWLRTDGGEIQAFWWATPDEAPNVLKTTRAEKRDLTLRFLALAIAAP